MNLWRLHIRPHGGDGNVGKSLQFCLDNGIVGMGWAVSESTVTKSDDWAWYQTEATKWYGSEKDFQNVKIFANEAKIGDLVWFRDLRGQYYVAQLESGWMYKYENDHIDTDIVNFRSASIKNVGDEEVVPGRVIASFRAPKTFQSIKSKFMLEYTKKIIGINYNKINHNKSDMLEYFDDSDIEDIVSLYLQHKDWVLIPSTKRVNTPFYEFILIKKGTGERAILQVKSGKSHIDATIYAGNRKAFLFSADENYGTKIPENVELINKNELLDFILNNKQVIPIEIKNKIEMMSN